MGFSGGSIVLIILVALFLFGPNKLPEMGKAAGKTVREFRNATKDITNDPKKENKRDHR